MSETYTVEERERAYSEITKNPATFVAIAHEKTMLTTRLSAENERLRGRVEEARVVIEGFRLSPMRRHDYCKADVKYPDWETPQDDRCLMCEQADKWLSVSDSQEVEG